MINNFKFYFVTAILSAAFPEDAPFMSDEGMLSTPGVEATDSTIAEYVNYSDQLRNKTEWLKQRGKFDPHFICFLVFYFILNYNLL